MKKQIFDFFKFLNQNTPLSLRVQRRKSRKRSVLDDIRDGEVPGTLQGIRACRVPTWQNYGKWVTIERFTGHGGRRNFALFEIVESGSTLVSRNFFSLLRFSSIWRTSDHGPATTISSNEVVRKEFLSENRTSRIRKSAAWTLSPNMDSVLRVLIENAYVDDRLVDELRQSSVPN